MKPKIKIHELKAYRSAGRKKNLEAGRRSPLQFLFIIAFAICVSIVISFKLYAYPDIENVVYVKNYDGDTITVTIPEWPALIGKKISVRVNGIDTPEMKDKNERIKILARRVKFIVQQRLENCDKITLKNPKRGKYFRIVADVYCHDENISKTLIDLGLAIPYDGGQKIEWKDYNEE
jgi:micrococcal nuclease